MAYLPRSECPAKMSSKSQWTEVKRNPWVIHMNASHQCLKRFVNDSSKTCGAVGPEYRSWRTLPPEYYAHLIQSHKNHLLLPKDVGIVGVTAFIFLKHSECVTCLLNKHTRNYNDWCVIGFSTFSLLVDDQITHYGKLLQKTNYFHRVHILFLST